MAGLIVLMVIGAFLQTAGVGLLVSVVNVVIDPEAVANSDIANMFFEMIGSRNEKAFSLIDSYFYCEKCIPICTTETDLGVCIYQPVPHFRAHDV